MSQEQLRPTCEERRHVLVSARLPRFPLLEASSARARVSRPCNLVQSAWTTGPTPARVRSQDLLDLDEKLLCLFGRSGRLSMINGGLRRAGRQVGHYLIRHSLHLIPLGPRVRGSTGTVVTTPSELQRMSSILSATHTRWSA